MARYGSDKKCTFCNKPLKPGSSVAISHIATTHDVIEKFIKPHLWVKRAGPKGKAAAAFPPSSVYQAPTVPSSFGASDKTTKDAALEEEKEAASTNNSFLEPVKTSESLVLESQTSETEGLQDVANDTTDTFTSPAPKPSTPDGKQSKGIETSSKAEKNVENPILSLENAATKINVNQPRKPGRPPKLKAQFMQTKDIPKSAANTGKNSRSVSPVELQKRSEKPVYKLKRSTTPVDKKKRSATPVDKLKRLATPGDKSKQSAMPVEKLRLSATPVEKIKRSATPVDKMRRSATPVETIKRSATPEEKIKRSATPVEKVKRSATPVEKGKRLAKPTEKFKRFVLAQKLKRASTEKSKQCDADNPKKAAKPVSSEDTEPAVDEDVDQEQLKCSLCRTVFSTRGNLRKHYSLSHFKTRILKHIGKIGPKNKCPECKKEFKLGSLLIMHMGAAHKLVDKLLEREQAIARKPLLKCFSCAYTTKFRLLLYSHYACVHYKKEILDLAITGNEETPSQSCPFCNYVSTKTNLIKHLGVVHNVVDRFLPKAYQVKPGRRARINNQHDKEGDANDVKNTSKSNKGVVLLKAKVEIARLHLKNDQQDLILPSASTTISLEAKPKSYHCFCCSYVCVANRSKLYEHYSVVHYKDEILQLIGKSRKCFKCEKPFHKEMRHNIIHVGITHSLVERFLPEQYHVAKKRPDFLSPSPKKDQESPDDRETADVPPDTSKRLENHLQCSQCSFYAYSRVQLYKHYVLVHYSDQLSKDPAVTDTVCRFCSKKFGSDILATIVHLGVTHGYIEKFLPPEDLIPGTRKKGKMLQYNACEVYIDKDDGEAEDDLEAEDSAEVTEETDNITTPIGEQDSLTASDEELDNRTTYSKEHDTVRKADSKAFQDADNPTKTVQEPDILLPSIKQEINMEDLECVAFSVDVSTDSAGYSVENSQFKDAIEIKEEFSSSDDSQDVKVTIENLLFDIKSSETEGKSQPCMPETGDLEDIIGDGDSLVCASVETENVEDTNSNLDSALPEKADSELSNGDDGLMQESEVSPLPVAKNVQNTSSGLAGTLPKENDLENNSGGLVDSLPVMKDDITSDLASAMPVTEDVETTSRDLASSLPVSEEVDNMSDSLASIVDVENTNFGLGASLPSTQDVENTKVGVVSSLQGTKDVENAKIGLVSSLPVANNSIGLVNTQEGLENRGDENPFPKNTERDSSESNQIGCDDLEESLAEPMEKAGDIGCINTAITSQNLQKSPLANTATTSDIYATNMKKNLMKILNEVDSDSEDESIDDNVEGGADKEEDLIDEKNEEDNKITDIQCPPHLSNQPRMREDPVANENVWENEGDLGEEETLESIQSFINKSGTKDETIESTQSFSIESNEFIDETTDLAISLDRPHGSQQRQRQTPPQKMEENLLEHEQKSELQQLQESQQIQHKVQDLHVNNQQKQAQPLDQESQPQLRQSCPDPSRLQKPLEPHPPTRPTPSKINPKTDIREICFAEISEEESESDFSDSD